MSQPSNSNKDNAVVQQEESSASRADQVRRYFFDENDSGDLRPPNERIKKHTWVAALRLDELITNVIHWGVIIEREHKQAPMAELPMSIRRRVLELEDLIAPEMKKPQNIFESLPELRKPFSYEVFNEYVEVKWLLILQKKENPHVKKLIELMKVAGVPEEVFIKSLASYAFVSLDDIHIHARPLSEFVAKDITSCLEKYLVLDNPRNLDLAVKSITHVLMKA